jgi:hypothetical protein
MDQFEAARLKALKRQERQARQQAPVEVPAEVVVPKAKETGPSNAAIIDVTVTLPNGEFSLRLVKPAVFQNASPARLTKNEFKNRLMEGLRPLLGAVTEG